ncbi:dihydroorotate dehydrogenase-like protein [Candidatus Latescibacterota bacterium]
MASLKTTYMGLDLENPLIVSSCGITGSLTGIKKCAEAGAGAIVLKSMFEELIIAKSENLEHDLIQSEHPEAYEYLRAELGMQIGPRPYLKFIEDVKSQVSFPVIASVNCVTSKWWGPYAENIEAAGADGIELNISHFPYDKNAVPGDIEKRYIDIVSDIVSKVSIPVAVKPGYYFTSLGSMLEDIVTAGAKALVLFNRYYTVDVDLDKKCFIPSVTLSSSAEMTMPLRWTGMLAGKLDCDIAPTTGIHDSDSVVKMLMAGATAVQLCSTLYTNGPLYLSVIADELSDWLDREGYASVDDIRGLALKGDDDRDVLLKRLQYMKSIEDAAKYEY